jgi:hypothetical protein
VHVASFCTCPRGLEAFLDRRVEVGTKCGKITGILRAFGETFLEVQEDDPKVELTVIQCGKVCYVRMIGKK